MTTTTTTASPPGLFAMGDRIDHHLWRGFSAHAPGPASVTGPHTLKGLAGIGLLMCSTAYRAVHLRRRAPGIMEQIILTAYHGGRTRRETTYRNDGDRANANQEEDILMRRVEDYARWFLPMRAEDGRGRDHVSIRVHFDKDEGLEMIVTWSRARETDGAPQVLKCFKLFWSHTG